VPASDWIERGLEAMAGGDAELVAGRIDLALDGEPSIAALVDLGRGYLNQEGMVEEGYAATANLWARRDVVDRVGHFREIWSGGDQDRDLVERMVAEGARLRYAPDLVVAHPPRHTVRELARKEFRLAYGAAELRRFSVGPLRGERQVWTRPRLYVPWRHRSSWTRLERAGYRVRGLDRLRMRVVQYTCLQLVQAAGSLLGTWQTRGREA
jgi:GT2 family glycosyltransferase